MDQTLRWIFGHLICASKSRGIHFQNETSVRGHHLTVLTAGVHSIMRNRLRSKVLGWMIGGGSVLSAGLGFSQGVDRYGDIPADSVAVLSIEVGAVMAAPQFAAWPWEIAAVACREQFGFDLNQIDTVDVTVSMPSPMPEFGVSVRTKSPYDIAELTDQVAGPIEKAPKDESLRFRDFKEAQMVRVAQKDPQRVLVGTQGTLRRMLSQRIQTGGPIVPLVQSSPALAKLAINLTKVRDLILGAYHQTEADMPDSIRDDVLQVIELTDNVMLEVTTSESRPLRLTFGTSSPDNTKSLDEALTHLRTEGLELARESVAQQMEADDSITPEMKGAIANYSDRVQKMINEESLWSMVDDRIEMKTEASMMASYQTIGVMTGLLLPAVQAARTAARRMQSSNNMRQFMLALLNYESAYKRFPPRASSDKEDDKPLLSWRVAILPFIEENQLYQEFKQDEPWDSEHNIRLLDRMPNIYKHPNIDTPPGHTVYVAPYGEGTGWPEGTLRLRDITDGTSNSIALVEVKGELSVPWTKPEDLNVDEHPGASWIEETGAWVAFFDGSVQRVSAFVADEVLAAFFTINGGEVVSVDSLFE
jgi:hypothetical protein